MVFDWVREARLRGGWGVHRELTVTSLRGIPVQEVTMEDWHRMCDELTDNEMTAEMDYLRI
jgi:hypothetical protein